MMLLSGFLSTRQRRGCLLLIYNAALGLPEMSKVLREPFCLLLVFDEFVFAWVMCACLTDG